MKKIMNQKLFNETVDYFRGLDSVNKASENIYDVSPFLSDYIDRIYNEVLL